MAGCRPSARRQATCRAQAAVPPAVRLPPVAPMRPTGAVSNRLRLCSTPGPSRAGTRLTIAPPSGSPRRRHSAPRRGPRCRSSRPGRCRRSFRSAVVGCSGGAAPCMRSTASISSSVGAAASGLVGESGCGKSTVARLVAGVARATSGEIIVDGKTVNGRVDRRAHSRRVQMVFQHPLSSLNPRMTVGEQVAEPLRVHNLAGRRESRERARDLLAELGLRADAAETYPGQLSGGQLQRVVIARALILDPPLIVCDEPTSSLDVSIQAEVIDLLDGIRSHRLRHRPAAAPDHRLLLRPAGQAPRRGGIEQRSPISGSS